MSTHVDIPVLSGKTSRSSEGKKSSHLNKQCTSVTMIVFLCLITILPALSGFTCDKNAFCKNLWWWPCGSTPEYEWCPGFHNETAPLHEYLPCSSTDLLQTAYETEFIQGMKRGTLNPTNYSRYDLQDWVYLQGGATLYGSVCDDKPCDAVLRDFFDDESISFQELADGYPLNYATQTNVADVVNISEATEAYVVFENATSMQHPPQYTAVIMAPCLQIWAMLATRLYAEGAVTPENAYSFWIEGNRGYVSDELNAILDSPTYDFDKTLALEIYQEGVRMEIDMFRIAD